MKNSNNLRGESFGQKQTNKQTINNNQKQTKMKRQLLILSLLFILISGMAKAQTSQLWGMTSGGGANNGGTIFKMDLNGGSYSVIYSFASAVGTHPNGSLLKVSNKLYGLTSTGGSGNNGVLFCFDLSTFQYSVKVNFDAGSNINVRGSNPMGSLIQDGNYLYGMTSDGGSNGNGVIFRYNYSTNSYSKLIDFSGTNGDGPTGSLIKASDGMMYGMTKFGGTFNYGVLFRFDPSNAAATYTKWDFGAISPYPCRNPGGSLIQSGNLLYGTTSQGGQCDKGTVISFNITSPGIQKVMEFCGITPDYGSRPHGNITAAGAGKFFGLASADGSSALSSGCLFSFTDYSTLHSVKYNFTTTANKGLTPNGSLFKASNGMYYGTTCSGGVLPPSIGYGVTFKYDPNATTGAITVIHNFTTGSSTDGHTPLGDLIEFSCSAPATPTSITGPPEVCFGINTVFSISAVTGATSYQWSAGGGNIQSSTGTSITVKFGNGGTNVTVKALNGCGVSGTKTKAITVVTCRAGESEQISEEVKMDVFPNPTNGFATIKFSSNINQSCELIIADLTGRIIEHEQFNSTAGVNELSLDMSNLIKGIYFVKIKASGKETVKRVVRQ
ncbi:MAG: choice-of-anchor tandem repeat GloVer-containing protein [Bacteroidota bacterium]